VSMDDGNGYFDTLNCMAPCPLVKATGDTTIGDWEWPLLMCRPWFLSCR